MIRIIFIFFFSLPFFAMAQQQQADTTKPRKLKEVRVKARWQNRHAALNKQYVIREEFRAIEHYTFDLRDPINPGREYFVLDFLNRELPPGWQSSSVLSCSSGVQYFIDENEVPASIVATRPLSDFAYAKVFQDLHPPCPCIVLYTRKGEDLKRK